jgi:uncharacterized protein
VTAAIHHVAGQGFFIDEGGKRLAEMTYEASDHTWVSPELRGQRIARKLLDALVSWAREAGMKVQPVCSYAVREFEQDASIRDVLWT